MGENTGSIQIDESRWPLVLITFQGVPSDEVFDEYLAGMRRLLDKKEKHVYLLDGRKGGLLSREQRIKQGRWLKENKEDIVLYSLGAAVVLNSAVLRFVLTTIFLIQSPLAPQVVVSTMEEGRAWTAERLWIAGLKIPSLESEAKHSA